MAEVDVSLGGSHGRRLATTDFGNGQESLLDCGTTMVKETFGVFVAPTRTWVEGDRPRSLPRIARSTLRQERPSHPGLTVLGAVT